MSAPPSSSRPGRDLGFTLVEVLVVVVVLGVLAAIAVPVFLGQREKAQVATLRTDLRSVALMHESWYADGYSNADAVAVASGGYSYQNANSVAGVFPGSGELRSPGMGTASITRGTGVIVISGSQAGFCVAGNRRGTRYDYATDGAPSGPGEYGRFLFYDSLLGGIRTRAELTASGACAAFR